MDEIRRQEPLLKDPKDPAHRGDVVDPVNEKITDLQKPSEPCVPPLPQQRSATARTTSGMAAGAAPAAAPQTARENEDERGPLFANDEANELRAQWDRIQVGFVDEPRKAVAEADQLVARAMKRLGDIFQEERQKMERQWDQGDNVSTEDLRQALRRYRSFFGRLLSV